MNQTSRMSAIARQLISFEDEENSYSNIEKVPAFLVCETLRPHLVTLMGSAGFKALLTRALAIASGKLPLLRSLYVSSSGKLQRLDNACVLFGPEENDEGGIVLIEKLLELLAAFIGENLTLHLLYEVWPKLPRRALDSEKGETHENQK